MKYKVHKKNMGQFVLDFLKMQYNLPIDYNHIN